MQLGETAALAADAPLDLAGRPLYRYSALNLNCGCPSEKVRSPALLHSWAASAARTSLMCTFVAQVAGKGSFGAALMSDPEKVRDLCAAMHDGSDRSTQVTVKCRIDTDALHGRRDAVQPLPLP